MHSRMKELGSVRDVDILFMGSSHAYRGFDTRTFEEAGISCFNLASSSQSPIQSLALLRDHIDQLNPRLVVFEVYPGIFGTTGEESALDLLANSDMTWETFKMVLSVNSSQVYSTFAFDFFTEVFGINQDFEEPKYRNYDTYIAGGYVEKDTSFIREQDVGSKFSWTIGSKQWRYFLKIVDLLESKDIDLLMVQSPIDVDYFGMMENMDEVDSIFQSIGDYINFNDHLHLNYGEDLYDRHHLKQSGVKKFNELIISMISEKGYLK